MGIHLLRDRRKKEEKHHAGCELSDLTFALCDHERDCCRTRSESDPARHVYRL